MQALMTVTLFPPFGWMFMRIHRAFLQPDGDHAMERDTDRYRSLTRRR